MKWSQYNHIMHSQKHGIFIFNATSNSFVKISKKLYDKILLIKDWNTELQDFENDFIKVLTEHKIIVPENFDSEVFYNKKYLKYLSSFNPPILGLTIATTTACNFKCPYCYEKGIKTEHMGIEVENAIIKYLASFQKPVHITWYGGEPLMNWQTIERLTTKITELQPAKKVSYTLVTNGFALTPDKCEFFAKTNLQLIQITLDGVENTHNRSRISKNGKPSYKTIMSNIDYALKALPATQISIRVNIGQHNKEDYPVLRDEVYRRWEKYRNKLSIYFNFIIDYKNCKSSCLTTKQQIEYTTQLYHNHQIIAKDIFPSNHTGVCCANKSDSYVVSPDGSLYKCWVDLGKIEKKVGTIFEPYKITNLNLLSRYSVVDKFNEPKCRRCFLLPLCGGVCPALKGASNIDDICPYDFKNIDSILEILYEIIHDIHQKDSKLIQAKKILPKGIKS